MRFKTVNTAPNKKVRVAGNGVGLVLSPEANVYGKVHFDDALEGIRIRPRMRILKRFKSLTFSFTGFTGEGAFETVILDDQSEAVEWPAYDERYELLSTATHNTVANGNVDVELPAVSYTPGEYYFSKLLGTVQVVQSTINFVCETIEVRSGTQYVIDYARSIVGSKRFVALDTLAYPRLGGFLRIRRTSGAGAGTFQTLIQRST
ncbi:MAG: hypothetical protein ACPG77_02805 [Nannocystaceae bacterium]